MRYTYTRGPVYNTDQLLWLWMATVKRHSTALLRTFRKHIISLVIPTDAPENSGKSTIEISHSECY